MMTRQKNSSRIAAIFVVFLTLAVLFVPISSDCDTDAAVGETYTYTISTNGTVSGYNPIGISSSTGSYTSVNGSNSGSWAFDDDGYGPFNSFYAAFDPARNNKMIGHLNPDDLTKLVDGTSIAGQDYNIMWCLPTVYWMTSGTSLVLTNDPNAGGTAYAHTINGHVYSYIGIGVYEASKQTISGQTILTSFADVNPTVNQTKATFRDLANNQLVNTDDNGNNGYAMLWNFYQWELYKYCAIAVMGSWDSQGVAGNGHVYGKESFLTGVHDKSGPYAGTKGNNVNYYKDSVKVFIENAWGSYNEFLDGVVVKNREYYIDQSAVPTDSISGTYITNPNGKQPQGTGYGYSPSTETPIWGMPTAASLTNSSGTHDCFYSHDGSDPNPIHVGGSYDLNPSYATTYGISYTNCLYNSSFSNNEIGTRLAFVFDNDPMSANTVTFYSNNQIVSTQLVPSGMTVIAPDVILYGYILKGWFTDPSFQHEFDFTVPVNSDIALYAKWEGILQYTTDPVADGDIVALSGQPGTISFRATDSEDFTSVLWDFGDGQVSTDLYSTHYYAEPGSYTATLTVYNNHGSDTMEFLIEVPQMAPGGGGNDLLLWVAVGLMLIVAGGLVVRRLL